MSYQVEVDTAPAYEFVISLYAYFNAQTSKTQERGKKWSEEVRERLTPSFASELEEDGLRELHRFALLIPDCPGDRSAQTFLAWLKELPPHVLYDRLAPWIASFPGTLQEVKERALNILEQWYLQYFAEVESQHQDLLEQSVQQFQNYTGSVADLVETATNGWHFQPESVPQRLVLVPQIHAAPTPILASAKDLFMVNYPVENETTRTLRILRTLGDDNRMQILQFVAEGPKTFTEIAKHSGMIKGKAHYHLSALRHAGLVRSHFCGERLESYGLRDEEMQALGSIVLKLVRG